MAVVRYWRVYNERTLILAEKRLILNEEDGIKSHLSEAKFEQEASRAQDISVFTG